MTTNLRDRLAPLGTLEEILADEQLLMIAVHGILNGITIRLFDEQRGGAWDRNRQFAIRINGKWWFQRHEELRYTTSLDAIVPAVERWCGDESHRALAYIRNLDAVLCPPRFDGTTGFAGVFVAIHAPARARAEALLRAALEEDKETTP